MIIQQSRIKRKEKGFFLLSFGYSFLVCFYLLEYTYYATKILLYFVFKITIARDRRSGWLAQNNQVGNGREQGEPCVGGMVHGFPWHLGAFLCCSVKHMNI